MFNVRIIDYFSVLIIDLTTADNTESTRGTGTNDVENDNGVNTDLYSGQVASICGLFGNFIDTGSITASISGSNCDHKSYVEDELLSNWNTRGSICRFLILFMFSVIWIISLIIESLIQL